MLQLSGDLRFLVEAPQQTGGIAQGGVQDLDGQVTVGTVRRASNPRQTMPTPGYTERGMV
jgi:hypothetical protein